MAREVKTKNLVNTRLANNYGGWIYCSKCNENIGNLCYQTYDSVDFKYVCNCDNEGSMQIDFVDSKGKNESTEEMVIVKNRFCCPNDLEPLITLLDKKLVSYDLEITCKNCANTYKKIK